MKHFWLELLKVGAKTKVNFFLLVCCCWGRDSQDLDNKLRGRLWLWFSLTIISSNVKQMTKVFELQTRTNCFVFFCLSRLEIELGKISNEHCMRCTRCTRTVYEVGPEEINTSRSFFFQQATYREITICAWFWRTTRPHWTWNCGDPQHTMNVLDFYFH